jgi:hypothetical protein
MKTCVKKPERGTNHKDNNFKAKSETSLPEMK